MTLLKYNAHVLLIINAHLNVKDAHKSLAKNEQGILECMSAQSQIINVNKYAILSNAKDSAFKCLAIH